jgi:hypothetical protein
MNNKTIIRYEIDGSRQFSIPIVKIIPDGDINIKISFPDAKTILINTNSTITITQEEDTPYPFSKLTANNQTLGSKMYFYNNGTIIINGKCIYEITHKIVYDG